MTAGIACLLAVSTTGCQHTINPFRDDLPAVRFVTTTSVENVRAAPRLASSSPREFGPIRYDMQSGAVSHWPLIWEDPFEDKGSEDGQLAWTWEDYFAIFYGPGRFLVNTMAFPISEAVTPPWTVMCSDGRLSEQALGFDHDATRCPAGAAPPIDLVEIGTVSRTP